MADPAAFEGSEEGKRQEFMNTALILKRRIELMLAQPLAKLGSLTLQREVQEIGKTV